MHRPAFRALVAATAAVALGTTTVGGALALHSSDHYLDVAAWEIDGQPVPNREADLTTESSGASVQTGDRVTYLTRVVGRSAATAVTLSFNSPGSAYVLGSARGGTCGTPTEVAPGFFDLACTVPVNAQGTGELFTTFEITRTTAHPCGQPDAPVVTLLVRQPIQAASDLTVCAGSQAAASPGPSPAATAIPNTSAAKSLRVGSAPRALCRVRPL